MIIVLLIIALLFVLPNLYISLVLIRDAAWWAHLLLWTPSIVAFALLLSVRFSGFGAVKLQLFVGLLLCIALPQLLFSVVSILGKLTSFAWHPAANIGNGIGLCLAFILTATLLYGVLFGWKCLTVKQVEINLPNLPTEFDGYRIVQLSDLHVGTHGRSTAFMEKMVRRVNELQADLIVFTGDIVNTTDEEIKPFEQVLSQLKAPDGVMSVLGNHDYCLYGMGERPTDPRDGAKQVIQDEKQMGWDLLLNEHRLIQRNGAQIAIIGVENTGKPPFPEIGNLKGAMAGLPDSVFSILLSHDPSHWRMEVLPNTNIPLMLSGHTHAAQVKIGKWSPSQWLYSEWSGLYSEGNQHLYVSEGTGGTIPFRLGTKPEIIIFTLKKEC
ncbi:MAG: metallophosphoesterase [Bacteroidales bacterium]|nr:metallophosphoesterase [Bacteroidales bacterium]